jgi:SpoVK/Ycf46/Vps4 family AAA+-type ATPase
MLSGYFILFALAGYLNAGEYSDILDEFAENLNNDDEIDEIMDAMEYHEKERMEFADALSSLTTYVSGSANEELSDTVLRFESCILQLLKVAHSYLDILSKQRLMLLTCFDRIHSYFTKPLAMKSSSLYFDFQTLMEQYRYQIESEEKLIHQLMEILENDDIYTHLDSGGESSILRIIKQSYILIIQNTLDNELWMQSKARLLSFIQNNFMNEINSYLPVEHQESEVTYQDEISLCDDPHAVTHTSEGLSSYQNLYEIVNAFLGEDTFSSDFMSMKAIQQTIGSDPKFIHLVGASNTGKSFFCQDLQNRISKYDDRQNIHVIRPKVPSDYLAPLVGSMEDVILSLFTYLDRVEASHKVILILDDIHHLLGESINSSSLRPRRDHFTSRARATWMSCLDRLELKHKSNGLPWRYLVICTSPIRDEDLSDRYDYSFQLSEPDSEERRHIISNSLCNKDLTSAEESTLTELVHATIGKSRGEITMYCRQVLCGEFDEMKTYSENSGRLETLKRLLRSILPESIKNSALEGFADLKVWSAKELRSSLSFDRKGVEILPLIGDNANEIWKELENIIITPLCRLDALHSILYGNGKLPNHEPNKSISAGVLIHGDPGVGKTVIAHHCAAVACGINPNIRLIEVPCTSLIQKELGGSERNVQKLFATARAASPCILLLDGVENIAQVRGHDTTTEGTMDRLLSTLLIEMDGASSNIFEKDKIYNIAIIGVTHNPPSWIDSALLRPGRLEKCLCLEKPDISTRRSIFSSAIADLNIDFTSAGYFDPKEKVDLIERVAMNSHAKSAADILAMIEKAKMMALRDVLRSNSNDEHDMVPQMSSMSISYKYFLA